MSTPGFDDSEVRAFADQLRVAATRARPEVKKAIKKGALNIKDEAKDLITSQIRPQYLPNYAKTITFSLYGQGMVAEVGPENRGQGQLARGVEFGSVKKGPLPHLIPAWEKECPGFVDALLDAIWDPIA